MFIFSNLLMAVAHILEVALTIFYWLILIRAVISWVSPDPYNPVVQFLEKSTEWVLSPIRKMLPHNLRLGIDISPLIVFFAIIFLKSFLVKTLADIAIRMR